jgi:hypothetical protein
MLRSRLLRREEMDMDTLELDPRLRHATIIATIIVAKGRRQVMAKILSVSAKPLK